MDTTVVQCLSLITFNIIYTCCVSKTVCAYSYDDDEHKGLLSQLCNCVFLFVSCSMALSTTRFGVLLLRTTERRSGRNYGRAPN